MHDGEVVEGGWKTWRRAVEKVVVWTWCGDGGEGMMEEFRVSKCEVAKLRVEGEVNGCGWGGVMDEVFCRKILFQHFMVFFFSCACALLGPDHTALSFSPLKAPLEGDLFIRKRDFENVFHMHWGFHGLSNSFLMPPIKTRAHGIRELHGKVSDSNS